MENSIHFSPLRYPGGKACIFPFISRLLEDNKLIGIDYAEPYAGGAGLALKLLFRGYVNKILINDLDSAIYLFWKTIIADNLRFCDWIDDVKVDIETWKYYKQIQNGTVPANEFEIAQATFFLNRTNISGVIKGGAIGGFEQKGKYKIDARFNKTDLISRIRNIDKFKEQIIVSNYDGISFIKKLNKRSKDVFIYLDPPYVQKGADLYMNYYHRLDHEMLSKCIKLIEKKWLISYDDSDFIIKLYSDFNKIKYRLSQSASNRIGEEILIFSNKIAHDSSFTTLCSASSI